MSAFSDDPIHQHATEGQKHHAATDKRCRDEEIASASNLEPGCFRERDVGRQKHQRKQRRNDDVDDLTGVFSQTFRRLRYQAFRKSHDVACKSAAKIRKLVKLPNPSALPKPGCLQSLSVWHKRPVCAFFRNRKRPSLFWLWFLGCQ